MPSKKFIKPFKKDSEEFYKLTLKRHVLSSQVFVVIQPFLHYKIGQVIRSKKEMDEILFTDYQRYVVNRAR